MHNIVVVLLLLLGCIASGFATPSGLERFFTERLDRNQDDVVDIKELQLYFTEMDSSMGSEIVSIRDLIDRIDSNNDGVWSWSEFRVAHAQLDEITRVASGDDPKQLHIAVTDTKGEMVINWVTTNPTATSLVQVGTTAEQYTDVFTGARHTYTAGGWKGWIHSVVLNGLAPDTEYHYRCGDNVTNVWSADHAFTTEAAEPQPAVFAAYGDMGVAIPAGFLVTRQIAEDHKKYKFGMVLHNGDLAYASTALYAPEESDAPVGGEWEWVWDVFCDQVSSFAASVPYMTGVGNHEKFYNYSSYLARFQMPSPWGGDPAGEARFWFSVDYGFAHFAFMSTEHDYSPGSEQYEWLRADLQKASKNRAQRPWLIVTGHRPMYSSDVDEWDQHRPGAPFQTKVEPLFEEFGVDLYLCGHMHAYERVHPLWNGTTQYNATSQHQEYINPRGTAHAMQGTAGVFTDHKWIQPTPSWSAVRLSYFGYGRLSINATHVHYEYEHTDTRKVVDDFWLVKTA